MANTEKRKPLPTIGVDRYTFFAVTTDNAEVQHMVIRII